jgi:hypothetical protein
MTTKTIYEVFDHVEKEINERTTFIAGWRNASTVDTNRVLIAGGDFNFVDNPTSGKSGGNTLGGKHGSDTWKQVYQPIGPLSQILLKYCHNYVAVCGQNNCVSSRPLLCMWTLSGCSGRRYGEDVM